MLVRAPHEDATWPLARAVHYEFPDNDPGLLAEAWRLRDLVNELLVVAARVRSELEIVERLVDQGQVRKSG